MNKEDKLMDIYGQYACYDDFFHLDDTWIGRVIVHKDNTFDGIAESYDGDKKYLLIGNVGKGYINCFVNGGDLYNPRLFKAFHDGPDKSKYYGVCFATDGIFDLGIGESKVTLREAEKTREVFDGEINGLYKQVDRAKRNLTESQRQMYDQIIESNFTTEPLIEEKKIK